VNFHYSHLLRAILCKQTNVNKAYASPDAVDVKNKSKKQRYKLQQAKIHKKCEIYLCSTSGWRGSLQMTINCHYVLTEASRRHYLPSQQQ
jgi:hypothetical protein